MLYNMHKISELVCVEAAVNIIILQCALNETSFHLKGNVGMGNVGLHTTTYMIHILGVIVGSHVVHFIMPIHRRLQCKFYETSCYTILFRKE